jgi:membrane protease subunit HflK
VDIKASGLRWHLPYPIESRIIVDVGQVRTATTTNKPTMLTQDENIVELEIAVQYRVKDPADYVFNVRAPDNIDNQNSSTLFRVMESSVREVVGKNEMDFILGEGRAEIAASTKELMQRVLDGYGAGLEVTSVNLQQVQPPEAVQGAFADAIKAREDEARFKNEAEAYSNGVIPRARGEAARITQEADAYAQEVVARANGEAGRFLKLLVEYNKAPEVTRERLYLESVQSVLARSGKVMVSTRNGSSNLLYLPLDKLMKSEDLPSLPSATVGTPILQNSDDAGAESERRARSDRSGRVGR